ncbi:hypothetical protein AJ88_04155 [Mesorhizobium amorphae CCBAU 01583]|nr:hypothetical protein AJ88_04155 [Mesorhizobium amorphae CCBAU 01583]
MAFDHRGDKSRNLVLQCEDVVEGPVVPLGPQVGAGGGVNQLCGDPNAITELSYAAFDEVANSEFAMDFGNVQCRMAKLKR